MTMPDRTLLRAKAGVALAECPDCWGDGTIDYNPSLRGDPQLEQTARCPTCHGDGTIPAATPTSFDGPSPAPPSETERTSPQRAGSLPARRPGTSPARSAAGALATNDARAAATAGRLTSLAKED
jgi:hypothetical protein